MLLDKVIGIYCLIDDIVKGIGHREHEDRKVSDSEVMTTAVISALYFKGNQSSAVSYVRSHQLMPQMIGKSGFCKRLHKVASLLLWLFLHLGRWFKYVDGATEYIIDSFPVKVCHNIRISRCKLLQGEQWRGYNVSKREYFYGVKVHLITTKAGVPVELCFVPGSEHDVEALRKMYVELPAGSVLYGDSAYTLYEVEQWFKDIEAIELKICRKKNSKRMDAPYEAFVKTAMRKRIETTISELVELTPHSIHAVTPQGFLLKILLFLLAYQMKTLI